MKTILHLDASARSNRSISRDLSGKFIETWLTLRPEDMVISRNIGQSPPSYVTEAWIGACFTPETERTEEEQRHLEESDILISELEKADIIVIGTPMYNYGMPAALKAWVDQVVRVNKTFSFDLERGDFPLEPIFTGKIMVCLTSKGEFGFSSGGVREKMNFLEPHIRTISHYLGVSKLHFISVEYQEFGDQRHKQSYAEATNKVILLAEKLSSNTSLSLSE